MRALKALAISFVFILVFSAAAFPSTNMPTWPQSFSIEKGETAAFAVPVTQPGTINVSIMWRFAC